MLSVIVSAVLASWSVDARGGFSWPELGASFTVSSVARDGWQCSPQVNRVVSFAAQVQVTRDCGLTEAFTERGFAVEHELWLSERPPGVGPLRVELAVQGGWRGGTWDAQRFAAPGAPEWRYAGAFVVAGEQRWPLALEHTEAGLAMVVPEAVLDAAGFPLHIDPVVEGTPLTIPASMGALLPVAGDQAQPTVAVADGGTFLIAWTDSRRASRDYPETDVYGFVRFPDGGRVDFDLSASGAQHSPQALDLDDGILLAWEDEAAGKVYARKYFSNGGFQDVGSWQGGRPSLARAGSQVYLTRADGLQVVVQALDGSGSRTVFANSSVISTRTAVNPMSGDVVVAFDQVLHNVVVSTGAQRTMVDCVRRPRVGFDTGGNLKLICQDATGYKVSTSALFMLFDRLMGQTLAEPLVWDGQDYVLSYQSASQRIVADGLGLFGQDVDVTVASQVVELVGVPLDANRLLVAWAVGPEGARDVRFQVTPRSPAAGLGPEEAPRIRSALQRRARIAARNGTGFIAWLENDQLLGAWVVSSTTGVQVQPPKVLFDPSQPGVTWAHDVALLEDGTAVVAWLRDSSLYLRSCTIGASCTGLGIFGVGEGRALSMAALGDDVRIAVATDQSTWVFKGNGSVEGGAAPRSNDVAITCAHDAGCFLVVQSMTGVQAGWWLQSPFDVPQVTGPITVTWDPAVGVRFGAQRGANYVLFDDRGGEVSVRPAQPRAVSLSGPVAAVSLNGNRQVQLVEVGAQTQTTPHNAWDPDVALLTPSVGAMVATVDVPTELSTSVLLHPFSVTSDGGADAGLDAGEPDAGEVDAGHEDAGSDAGAGDGGASDGGPGDAGLDRDAGVSDGGPNTIGVFTASGCTCQSGAPSVWLWLMLLGVRGLRRRT